LVGKYNEGKISSRNNTGTKKKFKVAASKAVQADIFMEEACSIFFPST
jgi:hypothetical protein